MAGWDRRDSYSYGGYGGRSRTQGQSLLQVVIRKLVDSIDDEEREQHYQEIKHDLEVAEENMNDTVEEHQDKLHSTLATFGKIDSTIKDSQAKVHMLKEHLLLCKTQLKCKRDELKRLWQDDVKFKKMLKLIDSVTTVIDQARRDRQLFLKEVLHILLIIMLKRARLSSQNVVVACQLRNFQEEAYQHDEMKHVPELLQQYRTEKKYYQATELLMNSVAMLDGELSNIEAMKELRTELRQQMEVFHVEVIDELQHRLYTKATGSAYKAPPTSAKKRTQNSHSPLEASSSRSPLLSRSSMKNGPTFSKSGAFLDTPVQTPPLTVDDQIDEDQFQSTESDEAEYLGSLVEALSMLKRVPEMIEVVQQRMKKELLLIVERTSIRIGQKAEEEGVPSSQKPSSTCDNTRYLRSLLERCFKQFEDVVSSHRVLLQHLTKAKQSFKANYELYSESDVWAGIQQVIREILEVYLAVDEDKPQSIMNPFGAFHVAGHSALIPNLHRRKVPTKARKQPLFRFDNSRHALSISSYIKEQRDKELVSQVKSGKMSQMEHHTFEDDQPSISQHMVCKPSARNITVMYSPVRDFVLCIEDAIHLQPDTHCELYHFLQDFVEQRFLDSIAAEYKDKVDAALKPEAKELITLDNKLLRGSGKIALLSSSLVMWKTTEELYQLMTDMPMFSAHFLSTIIQLLQAYCEECQAMFRDYSATAGAPALHGHGDKFASHKLPVVSAKWVRDEGIVRLMKSFNAWERMKVKKNRNKDTGVGKESIHNKETENLLKSMGAEIYHRSDVIQDSESLKHLGVLHESMEWLGNKLNGLLKVFESWEETTDGGSFSKALLKRHSMVEAEAARENDSTTLELIQTQFTSLCKEVLHLSETCIIVLHLEVRTHCFFYMIPTLKNSNYVCENEVTDADEGIKELAEDLRTLKLVTAGVLTSEKQSYLFEGIGHLCSAIFISSTQYLKKININGVKKMCRNIHQIQSCLSKITSVREKDLDQAQKYFSMLYVNEEEFLKLVMEQGKVFDQRDYGNAMTLLSRSQAQHNEIRLQKNLEKLDQMFNEEAC